MRFACTVLDPDRPDTTVRDLRGDEVGPAASAPKILVLIEAARRMAAGDLDPTLLLDRRVVDPVGDSGAWQHLRSNRLPVADLCALVAAVSDNLATNVLVHHLGSDAVDRRRADLGLVHTRWLDVVRDERDPTLHPPSCSTATTAELARLMVALHRGEVLDPAVSNTVLTWLDAGVDVSLGADAFFVDPLAHTPADLQRSAHPLRRLALKTGADTGLRVEVGLAVGRDRSGRDVARAWAARATFDADDPTETTRAVEAFRVLGRELRDQVIEAA